MRKRIVRSPTAILVLGLAGALVAPALYGWQVDIYQSGTGAHETRTADAAGLTAATSRCEISSDLTYGTRENPIKLSGPGHPASREIGYMSALRGPAGQGLHFLRAGSVSGSGSILDLYLADYPGISEPRKLYIDGYQSAPAFAPTGWLCGAPIIGVMPPAADPLAHSLLMALAVKLGDGKLEPISLDPDGSARHGVVFDHVRLIALAGRAARDRGTRLDATALPPDVARARLVIVAYPTACRGKKATPEAIVYTERSGHVESPSATARGERISDLVLGFRAPAEALAVSYDTPWFFDDAQVTVKYSAPCDREPLEQTFNAESVDGSFDKQAQGIAPPGFVLPPEGAKVLVYVYFDTSGVPIFPLYVMGPWELKDAAMEAALKWRLKPNRLNRAPIFDFAPIVVDFPKR